jgi:hypothetical protein
MASNKRITKAQADATQAAARREALRRLAARDLRAYVHFTMPTYRENWHHRAFLTALQAVADGHLSQLIVTAPPRHGKSELISRRFPAFLVGGAWPGVSVLSASHTQDLANKMSRDVQRILSSAEHKAIFPSFDYGERKAFEEFDLADGSTYKAAGVGGPIAGRGANVALVDDPVANRQRAESKAERQRTIEWWTDDLSTRLEPPGARVLTATRWHADDLTGWILDQPGAEDWTHIHFPAILDSLPAPFDGDPRELGEPLWPGRYLNPRAGETPENAPFDELVARALKDLTQRRALNPYGFQALYQGWPTSRAGELFRRDALRTYTQQPQALGAACEWVCISVDATFGASKRSDYMAIAVMGGKGAHRYLLDEYGLRRATPRRSRRRGGAMPHTLRQPTRRARQPTANRRDGRRQPSLTWPTNRR